MNPLQLLKLPKWAQEYIIEIERQREAAVKALNDAFDNQTLSRIFTEDIVCVEKGAPSFFKKYIQAPRNEVTFNLDLPGRVRENQITVRIDCDDPTQVLISATWNQISLQPVASNVIALKGSRA